MSLYKNTALLLLTLTLVACGGSSGGHNNGQNGSSPVAQAEFGDVVQRLMQQQDNNTGEPEEVNPEGWSYQVNENEAAFNHLF